MAPPRTLRGGGSVLLIVERVQCRWGGAEIFISKHLLFNYDVKAKLKIIIIQSGPPYATRFICSKVKICNI